MDIAAKRMISRVVVILYLQKNQVLIAAMQKAKKALFKCRRSEYAQKEFVPIKGVRKIKFRGS